MRCRKIGFERNGVGKRFFRPGKSILRAQIPVVPPLDGQTLRVGIDRGASRSAELQFEGARNERRDLILRREDIRKVAIERVRP